MKRRNWEGSVVSYAHSERDLVTGVPTGRIIRSFGRADQLDPQGRRVDGEVVGRVPFAMIANRLSARPLSKQAG